MEEEQNVYVLKELAEKTLSLNLDSEWVDATLFTPYRTEQVLFYEYADCLAARTFLKMAGLPFRLEQRPNAEFMSPTGTVPFLKLQNVIVSEFCPLVDFIGKKGLRLGSTLTETEKSDLQAFIALIEEDLRNAEIYISWKDDETYNLITKRRYQSVYFFPLYLWLPMLRRRQMLTYLDCKAWSEKRMQEVLDICDKTFRTLSVKLSNHRYFIGDQPTELDALAFGHLYTILSTQMPNMAVAEALRKYQNLIDFTRRIDAEFFAM